MYPARTVALRRLWAMPNRSTAFCYAPQLNTQQIELFTAALRGSGAEPVTGERHDSTYFSVYRTSLATTAERSDVQAALRQVFDDAIAGGTDSGEISTALVSDELLQAPKKLIVMDVDSTLIQQEVIELLAAHARREAEVRAVTEAAMRGELDFAESLHARVATLAGLPDSVLAEVQEAIRLSPGAEELISVAKAHGHRIAAVSGGFSQILTPLAARLGLDAAEANELEIVDGVLTGRVLGAVVDRAAKARALRAWSRAANIPIEATVAIGDGANDLDMMAAAGLSLAFNAKPAVRNAADAAIWRLDLTLQLAGIG